MSSLPQSTQAQERNDDALAQYCKHRGSLIWYGYVEARFKNQLCPPRQTIMEQEWRAGERPEIYKSEVGRALFAEKLCDICTRTSAKMNTNGSYNLIFVFFLSALLFQAEALSEDQYFLNPGLKFGHTFGENGGYTVGFEISYTRYSSQSYGILASIDYCR